MGEVIKLYGDQIEPRFEVITIDGDYYIRDRYWVDLPCEDMVGGSNLKNVEAVCELLNKKVNK